MTEVEIRPVGYDDPAAQQLVTAALADLGQRYGGPGDQTPVAPTQFRPPEGGFFVAYLAGEGVGCGGWRGYAQDRAVAELKRMYVAPAARGRGVARRLLEAVEQAARQHGRTRMILECGDKQPEAVTLYRSRGYEPIPHFGYYKDAPGVISLGRTL
ncbi:GNAT family N-acetyltransferase [Natronosporangium hydrolyticum]|uniref:GNAT family N-acetyltransferase n=1 Tax=Natronosporangium hydrolyticum TaxID=2811111 RepID=A0A895YBC5_9ACTN|nr:GNAT family N-acetyltransferase [Natronosporangium hydrolyticum]QSB13585.1 GNAT family N-acetyltransferase [Natronosporangium hydrolyticum]